MVFLSNTSQLMMTGLRDTDLTLRGKAGSGSGLTTLGRSGFPPCKHERGHRTVHDTRLHNNQSSRRGTSYLSFHIRTIITP